jgi:hypothetical protein
MAKIDACFTFLGESPMGFSASPIIVNFFYHMSESYYPELARGIRWNDPDVAVPVADFLSYTLGTRRRPALPCFVEVKILLQRYRYIGSAFTRVALTADTDPRFGFAWR